MQNERAKDQERGGKERKRRNLMAGISSVNVSSHQPRLLLQMQIWIQRVWSGTWDSEFLASSQMAPWFKDCNLSSKAARNRPGDEVGGMTAYDICVILALEQLRRVKRCFIPPPLSLLFLGLSLGSMKVTGTFVIFRFSDSQMLAGIVVTWKACSDKLLDPTRRAPESVGLGQSQESCISS